MKRLLRLPINPLVAQIFKHVTEVLLLAISIYLIVELSQHPE